MFTAEAPDYDAKHLKGSYCTAVVDDKKLEGSNTEARCSNRLLGATTQRLTEKSLLEFFENP